MNKRILIGGAGILAFAAVYFSNRRTARALGAGDADSYTEAGRRVCRSISGEQRDFLKRSRVISCDDCVVEEPGTYRCITADGGWVNVTTPEAQEQYCNERLAYHNQPQNGCDAWRQYHWSLEYFEDYGLTGRRVCDEGVVATTATGEEILGPVNCRPEEPIRHATVGDWWDSLTEAQKKQNTEFREGKAREAAETQRRFDELTPRQVYEQELSALLSGRPTFWWTHNQGRVAQEAFRETQLTPTTQVEFKRLLQTMDSAERELRWKSMQERMRWQRNHALPGSGNHRQRTLRGVGVYRGLDFTNRRHLRKDYAVYLRRSRRDSALPDNERVRGLFDFASVWVAPSPGDLPTEVFTVDKDPMRVAWVAEEGPRVADRSSDEVSDTGEALARAETSRQGFRVLGWPWWLS